MIYFRNSKHNQIYHTTFFSKKKFAIAKKKW